MFNKLKFSGEDLFLIGLFVVLPILVTSVFVIGIVTIIKWML
jgi:hypothetical protein